MEVELLRPWKESPRAEGGSRSSPETLSPSAVILTWKLSAARTVSGASMESPADEARQQQTSRATRTASPPPLPP